MKKFLLLTLVAFAILGLFTSCAASEEDEDINGTWTLSTVDGVPAASLYISLTLTITDSATYTKTGSYFGIPTSESGTVTAKSDTVYTLTSSRGKTEEYTLDGDELTATVVDDGETDVYVFKK